MTHRNARRAQRAPEFTVRLANVHEEIHVAFVHTLKTTRCKQSQAARGMGVNVDTVRNYVHGRTPVNVARVLAHPRLAKTFRQKLCREHHDPAPYIARKRGRTE